jgi:hypothetical protein
VRVLLPLLHHLPVIQPVHQAEQRAQETVRHVFRLPQTELRDILAKQRLLVIPRALKTPIVPVQETAVLLV